MGGIFGSDSNSTTQNTNTAHNLGAEGFEQSEYLATSGNNNNVSFSETDHNTVGGAFELANRALDISGAAFSEYAGGLQSSHDSAVGSLTSTTARAMQGDGGATTDTVKWVVGAAVLVAIAMMYKGGK